MFVDEKKRYNDILELLRKEPDKMFSFREIARQLNIAPATAGKWLPIMELKGMLEIISFGNIKLVRLKQPPGNKNRQ